MRTQHGDLAGVPRQEHGRLAGGVGALDHVDVLAGAGRGLGRGRPVEDAAAGELLDAGRLQGAGS